MLKKNKVKFNFYMQALFFISEHNICLDCLRKEGKKYIVEW